MGIASLLPLLEKSTRKCNLKEFEGQRVAVDSYCWLHKVARSCCVELAKGVETDIYVINFMKYVKLLLSFKIKPIMVFDGRYLPAKKETEKKRKEAKIKAKQQGMEFLRLDQLDAATKCFSQCVDITPDMALKVIKECRLIGVDCIVAPYESDAQLAFFSIKDIAQCVISEDSDLLLFGCKKVLYKMDSNGNGNLVESEKIYLSMNMTPQDYTFDKFCYMCILSGCDYINSLPGIGLKKALKFLKLTAEVNPAIFLAKVPRYLNMRRLNVTEDYIKKFLIAVATFKHQLVFDPFQRKLIPLNPIDETDSQYCVKCGDYLDPDEAFQLALGNLNPLTMERIDDWYPDPNIVKSSSIWSTYKETTSNNKELVVIKESPKTDKKNIVISAYEKLKKECDDQLVKELQFYKSPNKISTEKENTPQKSQEETSPILNNYNPFAKKNICKFKTTQSTPEENVKSRYFSFSLDDTTSTLSVCSQTNVLNKETDTVQATKPVDLPNENKSHLTTADNIVKVDTKKTNLTKKPQGVKRQSTQLTLIQFCKRWKKN